jgi:hypothetical protein
MPAMIRVALMLLALCVLPGCARLGVLVYPPEAEPGDDWPRGWTGPDCSETSVVNCREVSVGTGEAVRAFAQITVRVTIEDTNPPATHGPLMVTFVYPAVEKIPFRGRDWDLTPATFADGQDITPFYARSEAAMLGANVIGMRMGGVRRVTESFAGKLGTLDLPPGQPRHYTIELTQVCYPELRVSSRLRSAFFEGGGSPVRLNPLVTITGCGHH